MSQLPKKAPFDFKSIKGIRSIKDVVQWLTDYAKEFEKWYTKLLDTVIGKILGESRRWRIIENGDDLEIQWKNDSDVWIYAGVRWKRPT